MANDDEVGIALGAVALAVTVALAVVLGAALGQARHAALPAVPAVPDVAEPAPLEDVLVLDFAAGSPAVPVDAQAVLSRVADVLRAEPGRRVYIGTTLQAGQDVAAEAAAAQARAQAVAHALEAYGVPRQQLVPEPPQPGVPGSGATRVELRVR